MPSTGSCTTCSSAKTYPSSSSDKPEWKTENRKPKTGIGQFLSLGPLFFISGFRFSVFGFLFPVFHSVVPPSLRGKGARGIGLGRDLTLRHLWFATSSRRRRG